MKILSSIALTVVAVTAYSQADHALQTSEGFMDWHSAKI
jgi:hypothetical protein